MITRIAPTPNGVLTLELDCYAYLVDVAADEDSNWFTVRMPEVVLWEAARFYHLMLHEKSAADAWHETAVERIRPAMAADAREAVSRQHSLVADPYRSIQWARPAVSSQGGDLF